MIKAKKIKYAKKAAIILGGLSVVTVLGTATFFIADKYNNGSAVSQVVTKPNLSKIVVNITPKKINKRKLQIPIIMLIVLKMRAMKKWKKQL
ncbi:hypothetical protein [Mycoplasma nasistruthionis]|uniref:Uncharacterized protein n=1 Tax=Mycoplasma nasistruthionis TaxID=353852 RepID=A0A5B7XVL3_9MOLU|nr:hypothetical protein [Mycoplasma nasistruthionis]QCZ36747.1 hypothetical protein FG904_01840 [Mycoplasma nasistruthionis]